MLKFTGTGAEEFRDVRQSKPVGIVPLKSFAVGTSQWIPRPVSGAPSKARSNLLLRKNLQRVDFYVGVRTQVNIRKA
jgi:hypothetical protein